MTGKAMTSQLGDRRGDTKTNRRWTQINADVVLASANAIYQMEHFA
jgi:hypothetical protein